MRARIAEFEITLGGEERKEGRGKEEAVARALGQAMNR
jgi:hypothetical protein